MSTTLYASNIHQGGGKTLLIGLLDCLADEDATAYIDERLPYNELGSRLKIVRVTPTLLARIIAEATLKKHLQPEDLLICFGNLPPLIARHPRTVLFLQNRFLFGSRNLADFPLKVRLRIAVERRWLRHRLSSAAEIVVQTKTMAREFFQATGRRAIICPFIPSTPDHQPTGKNPTYDFLYVASGEPHKNHRNLIAAWEILAAEGLMPTLALTVDERVHPEIQDLLSPADGTIRLNVFNHSDQSKVESLYRSSRALIYPATLESLGLPLLEARSFGLPILASELDFVRDTLDPEQTFDPKSPVSIARSVQRFLGHFETRPAMATPAEFLKTVREIPFK